MIFISNNNLCLKCSYEWTKRAKTPTQCPNCGTRKWFEPNTDEKYFKMFGQMFVLIEKISAGKMTHVRYSLEQTEFKDKDYFPMYDFTFLSLKTKETFIAWASDADWDKLKSGIFYYKQIPVEFYHVIKDGMQEDKVRNTSVKWSLSEIKFIKFDFDRNTNQWIPYLANHL